MGQLADQSNRDSAWLEALFRQHGKQVLAYATRRAPGDADDIVAEVFAAAWKHRANIPTDTALPWLYRTAAHHVLHSHRSRNRRAELASRSGRLDEPDRDLSDPADDIVERVDHSAAVARVMAALPPKDAEVLRLWAWEQLDGDEIAYVLGTSSTAARVRLHRAKRRAEALLTEGHPAAPFPRVTTPVVEEH